MESKMSHDLNTEIYTDVFFLFWPHPQDEQVAGPGIERVPQQ